MPEDVKSEGQAEDETPAVEAEQPHRAFRILRTEVRTGPGDADSLWLVLDGAPEVRVSMDWVRAHRPRDGQLEGGSIVFYKNGEAAFQAAPSKVE